MRIHLGTDRAEFKLGDMPPVAFLFPLTSGPEIVNETDDYND